MRDDAPPTDLAAAAQLRYANVLGWLTHAGLLLLAIAFVAYVAGWLPVEHPPSRLAELWGLPLHEYLVHTRAPSGRQWLAVAYQGEQANLVGIAVLAAASIASAAAVLPVFWRRRDHVYVAVCIGILLVLLLAASGVLVAGR
jgi:hypothetical protein